MDGVAEHQTLPDVPAGPTTQHLMCHVDGAECEVTSAIMSALTGLCGDVSDGPAVERLAQSLGQAQRWLPCNHCRAATAAAGGLTKTRLGQRERSLLLRAASSATSGELVGEADDKRAIREAKMRAARKLRRAGLLWTGKRDVRTERRDRQRGKFAYFKDGERYYFREDLTQSIRTYAVVVGLTPLGEEIKRRYQDELHQGRAIRWDKRTTEAAGAVRQDIGALLRELEKQVRDYDAWAKGLLALVAQANPSGARDLVEQAQARNCILKAIETVEKTQ